MNNNIKISIIIVSLFLLIGGYLFLTNHLEKKYASGEKLEDYYIFPEKKENINTYVNFRISESELANIYFNNFMNKSLINLQEAYQLLENKNSFPDLNTFKNYINSVTKTSTIIPKIKTNTSIKNSDYTLYSIMDEYNNNYEFKVTSVFNYTVTIEKT